MLSQERGTANLCFTASILGKIEEEGERDEPETSEGREEERKKVRSEFVIESKSFT